MTDIERVIAEYERIARINRPDWAAFIAEARNEPIDIAYEVAETARDLGLTIAFDTVCEAAFIWIAAVD